MPTTYPTELKVKTIRRYKKGESIKSLKIKNYWVYLCVILDLYSRRAIGWRVSRHMSTNLITATFKAALQERRKPRNLTFHSDRGKLYISKILQNRASRI